ncbi:MAG TPA: ABC transporter permease [Candidatus Acidoferrales bacterium]|nr:ABC transporter permease [Candidatus Acidoferrales bacterium]
MSAFLGALRYEFCMQLRRRSVWVSIGFALVLLFALFSRSGPPERVLPPADTALRLVGNASFFLPVAFGILLADRWRRERSLGTLELLDSLPASLGARLWGKYFGATIATMIPLLLAFALFMLYSGVRIGDATLVRFLPLIFVVVIAPGLLFVAAFSIACTEWLPVPLYAVLFTGYWFWGNLVPPERMPTLNCTLLTPIGEYPAAAFFQHTDVGCFNGQSIPIALGLASIALLLATGALALFALQAYITRRAAAR